VDWSRSAVEIRDLIRGLHPWPHAFTFLNAKRLILLKSTLAKERSDADAGRVVDATGDRFRVATGNGLLQIDELQTEGGRPMPAREFLAGHRVANARLTPMP
jgi:methionyl-tRNA formyltransferase